MERVSTRIAAQSATAQILSIADQEQKSMDTSLTEPTESRPLSVCGRTTPILFDVDLTLSIDQTAATEAEAESTPTSSSALATSSRARYTKTEHYVEPK